MDIRYNDGTIIKASDYHLIHDKLRRGIVSSQRDGYVSVSFEVAEGLQNSKKEPSKRHSKARSVKDGRRTMLVGLLDYLIRR